MLMDVSYYNYHDVMYFSLRVSYTFPMSPYAFIGYVQSLIRRVANNVNIVVNNLILKYVEDDIVLSVNITSAECYTVDDIWERAFMDITGEQWLLTFLASRIN